ncbi:MAG: flagellar export chaperone FlgN [Planctomycetota bacterium]
MDFPLEAESLVRDALAQLAELQSALQQLGAMAGEKLAAMRRADAAALQDLAAREAPLLTELFRRESVRKATLARLAQTLQCAAAGRAVLTEIAARVRAPLRSCLQARMAALQSAAAELQRKNRLAAAVAQNLQAHVHGIFAAVAGSAPAPVYGPRGQQAAGAGRRWVDAVG